MQPTYAVLEREFGAELQFVDQTEKDRHVRHGTGIVLFAEFPGTLTKPAKREFYEPILDWRKGVDLDGRQRIQPIDGLML